MAEGPDETVVGGIAKHQIGVARGGTEESNAGVGKLIGTQQKSGSKKGGWGEIPVGAVVRGRV